MRRALGVLGAALAMGCGDGGEGAAAAGAPATPQAGQTATGGAGASGSPQGGVTSGMTSGASQGGSSGNAPSSGSGGAGGGGGDRPDVSVDCNTAPADECPFANGIAFACKKRFALGINYAWRNFGADFGGLAAWSIQGVAAAPAEYLADLKEMKAAGASVIRWWVAPALTLGGSVGG